MKNYVITGVHWSTYGASWEVDGFSILDDDTASEVWSSRGYSHGAANASDAVRMFMEGPDSSQLLLTPEFEAQLTPGTILIRKIRRYDDSQHYDVVFDIAGGDKGVVFCMGFDLNHENHAINRFKKRLREGEYRNKQDDNTNAMYWLPENTVVLDARNPYTAPVTTVGESAAQMMKENTMNSLYTLEVLVNSTVVQISTSHDGFALLHKGQQLMKDHSFYNLPWEVEARVIGPNGDIVLTIDTDGTFDFY